MSINKNLIKQSEEEPGKKSNIRKWIFVLTGVLACLVIICIGGFQVLKAAGKSNLQKNATSSIPELVGESIITDETGVVTYNGKRYKYNDSITTLLCMGIDTNRTMEETGIHKAGHADSMFLAVMDEKNDRLSLIAISRDSLTEIDIPYTDGTINYSTEGIVAHQYAYGDGKELSGRLTVNTVSEMLYRLPIHGYIAVHLDAVGILNDAVGGVTVTIPGDDANFLSETGFSAGQSVTLTGDQAIKFVRERNQDVHFTNNMRMGRQKQYLSAFVSAFKQKLKSDITMPVTMYQDVSDYLNTDLTVDKISYLSTFIGDMSFSDEDIYSIAGENKREGELSRFVIDRTALYELIIEVFYDELPNEGGFVEVTTEEAVTTQIGESTAGAIE